MITPSLEGFERPAEGPHDLAPSGPGSACVLDSRQRSAGAGRNDKFRWDLQAAGFGPDLDLPRGAHGLGDDVIAAEAEALQRRYRRTSIIAPMPFRTTGRKLVTRHAVA